MTALQADGSQDRVAQPHNLTAATAHVRRVAVALSGGVDSAVAACLLKEAGYEVTGVYLRLWDACRGDALGDAERVAAKLEIPLAVVDGREMFKQQVIRYFMDEYTAGRTPNPCVVCNPGIKWKLLEQQAECIGAEWVATGHYAKTVRIMAEDGAIGATDANGATSAAGASRLAVAMADSDKDQSYVLYRLAQTQLAHTLFPLGRYTKEAVRATARERGFPVAEKPDSQEICFVEDNDYVRFIRDALAESGISEPYPGFEPGLLVNGQGVRLGEHKGIVHYTVGQRKGLGIAAGERLYVQRLDAEANHVVLTDDTLLYTTSMAVHDVHFMAIPSLKSPRRAVVKIRYAHKPAPCTITEADGCISCLFDDPQRAVTPGQAAVFYENGHVLCGGVIH